MFIGRKYEKEKINYLLSNKGFQACLLYGRRRLGKTELLKECLLNKNIKTIFFQAKQVSERINTNDITSLIEKTFDLSNLYFERFVDALEFIFNESKNEKIYLVLDEYPYIRKVVEGIDSYLQNLIDFNQDNENLYLFLCGSSVSIMEEVISSSNPLYQRFSLILKLKEMNYKEASLFTPTYSNEEKVIIYSAFGGIPFYLNKIKESESIKENIIRILSGNSSLLENDINITLRAEIAKIDNANSVFNAIAYQKVSHFNDILAKCHFNSASVLNDVLEKLIKADFIKKVSPINDKNNKLKSYYEISSNSLSFYFKYIFSNSSLKEILSENDFYETFIKEDFLNDFVPKTFEKIAKEFLILKSQKHELDYLILNIGKYWYDDFINKKNGEFDIVSLSKDGYIFYEVKFLNKKVNKSIILKEIEQVKNTSLKAINYGFISKNGFDEETLSYLKENNYYFYTLDDLYKDII